MRRLPRRHKSRLRGTRRNTRRGEAVFAFPCSISLGTISIRRHREKDTGRRVRESRESTRKSGLPSTKPFRRCRERSSVMSGSRHLILSQQVCYTDLDISCVTIQVVSLGLHCRSIEIDYWSERKESDGRKRGKRERLIGGEEQGLLFGGGLL